MNATFPLPINVTPGDMGISIATAGTAAGGLVGESEPVSVAAIVMALVQFAVLLMRFLQQRRDDGKK